MSRKIKARKRSTAVRVLKVAGLAELVVFGAMSTVNVASADGMPTPEWAGEKTESSQTPSQSTEQHAGGSEQGTSQDATQQRRKQRAPGDTAQDSTQVKSEFDVL